MQCGVSPTAVVCHLEAMGDDWQWEKIEEIARHKRYSSGNDAFSGFKKMVLKASLEELDAHVDHAPLVWDFLVGFAGCKKMYRKLIIQVFNKLTESNVWVDVWKQQSELHEKMKTLHEDLQAALALQHEAIRKTVSPEALKSMALVRYDEQPEKIREAMEKERIVDEIKEEHGSNLNINNAFGDADNNVGLGLLQSFQEAVDSVCAINDPSAMRSGGRDALDKLRIACVQCAGSENYFNHEIAHAHQVFSFLLSYSSQHSDGTKGVAEVLNQLMASPSWAREFESSGILREALTKLPEHVQAAYGAQHEKLMNLISPAARTRAERGDIDAGVKGVASKMKSIRFTPADEEAAMIPPPPPPPPTQDWKEVKTPEGHTYYYNHKTQVSQWERPAEMGGPHVYGVGDEVEVWSNSLRKWGLGKVEKIEGEMVTAEFTLPDGNVAKKSLHVTHKDLRPAQKLGWSAEEQSAYRACFEKLEGGSTKPSLTVAMFLTSSGLSRQVLKQVWSVANSGGKSDLDFEDFANCCRLIAHCQAMGNDPLIIEADRPLRLMLRGTCLGARPPQLPHFA